MGEVVRVVDGRGWFMGKSFYSSRSKIALRWSPTVEVKAGETVTLNVSTGVRTKTVPSVVDGNTYPIHPLQIVAMGMLTADSLQFEDLARACEEEGRFEFMVVGLPLRLPGGTGSPWNPIAIF